MTHPTPKRIDPATPQLAPLPIDPADIGLVPVDPFADVPDTTLVRAQPLPSTKRMEVPFELIAKSMDLGDTTPTLSPFSDGMGDSFLGPDPFATTDQFSMDALLGTQTALVLGDPTNIVESVKLKIRMLDMDLNSSDLEDSDEDAAVGEKELFIGADVERLLTPLIVLERRHTAADLSVLSPFERFVLDQIDGKRTMHDIQFAMGLSEGDLRIAVALLADKHLVQRAPVAAVADVAAPTPPPPRPASSPPPPARAIPATPPPTPMPTPAPPPAPALKTVAARPAGTSIAGVLAALLTRAAREEEANNLTSAIEALIEAVQIDPGSAIGHNRLGVLYARTRQLPLAVEHLTRARDLRPADPTILSNYNKIVSLAEHTKKRR
jgi:hypothetical protein